MLSPRLRRLVAVLAVAGWIALVPAAAHAAEPFHLLQPAGGLFAQAWDFVAGLLGLESAGDAASATTTTDGTSSLDTTTDNGEHGATVDPNGRT